MKIREHRGTLEDSLKTVAEIPPTMEALLVHIQESLKPAVPLTAADVGLIPYFYDNRTQWCTYAVRIRGYGIWGFTDGLLMDYPSV